MATNAVKLLKARFGSKSHAIKSANGHGVTFKCGWRMTPEQRAKHAVPGTPDTICPNCR